MFTLHHTLHRLTFISISIFCTYTPKHSLALSRCRGLLGYHYILGSALLFFIAFCFFAQPISTRLLVFSNRAPPLLRCSLLAAVAAALFLRRIGLGIRTRKLDALLARLLGGWLGLVGPRSVVLA